MRYWNLTVTNGAWFEVHNGAMILSGLTLSNNSTFAFDTYASNGMRNLDMASMSITGNVSLAGTVFPGSCLWLPSGDYGFNTLSIGTNCTVYGCGNTNAVNGGSVAVPYGTGVVIRCQSALIDGTLSALRQGFPGATGPGCVNSASHGGRAGGDTGGGSGKTYGSLTQSSALGSGCTVDNHAGGGAIRLIVDGTLTLNGAVNADGSGGSGSSYGSSGGSLWLTANTLAGTGAVSAVGGRGAGQSGGGGGRVALEYVTSTFSGRLSVAGGACNVAANAGKTGTIFNCTWAAPGALPPFGNGVTLSNLFVIGSSTNSFTNGVIVIRTIAEWKTTGALTFTWTDRSMDGASNQLNSTATYRLSGLPPNKMYSIADNGVPMFGGSMTNSGNQGAIQFQVTLDAAHTIQVRGPPLGTIIMFR